MAAYRDLGGDVRSGGRFGLEEFMAGDNRSVRCTGKK